MGKGDWETLTLESYALAKIALKRVHELASSVYCCSTFTCDSSPMPWCLGEGRMGARDERRMRAPIPGRGNPRSPAELRQEMATW
jgi:hypothetical protein